MKLRFRCALILCLGLALPWLIGADSPKPVERPAVRAFDIATLSRLGREIYQHDQLAWKATDIVMAQVGMQRLQKDGARGWIVDTSNTKVPVVRFLRGGEKGFEALCDVTFPENGEPELGVPVDRALTPSQSLSARALKTAEGRFFGSKVPWCGGNPNTVVLNDPDGAGFLVYFLRAKPAVDQIPVGGHYRFTVSADGLTVEQVDQLFVSCLTLPRSPPDGKEPVALFMTNLVSDLPLETHVFLSLQEKIPFAVGAAKGNWMITEGEIRPMEPEAASDKKKKRR